MLFELWKTKNILIQVISDCWSPSNTEGEQISREIALKQVYSKTDDDSMTEVKYSMFFIITFPVTEAIVGTLLLTQ